VEAPPIRQAWLRLQDMLALATISLTPRGRTALASSTQALRDLLGGL
jgi:hypothetical protein